MIFPTRDELIGDLSDLLGASIEVEPGTLDPSSVGLSTWDFVDDNDVPMCTVSTELPLAHAAGAALAMMPPARAECDDPDAELIEYYCEVVNVLSGRVNTSNPIHVRLVPGSTGEGAWPVGGVSTCYSVTVGEYGTGVIGFTTV
ncbi:MAG: hypothetical protein P8N02_20385 [Actinomycetota bacterium]|jgi:hypothetical protein|nr:hypothetical protein [Actinomycetota bacterium]